MSAGMSTGMMLSQAGLGQHQLNAETCDPSGSIKASFAADRSNNSCLIVADCCFFFLFSFTRNCQRYKSKWSAYISGLFVVSLTFTFASWLRCWQQELFGGHHTQFGTSLVHVRRGLALCGEHPASLRKIRLNQTGSLSTDATWIWLLFRVKVLFWTVESHSTVTTFNKMLFVNERK